MPPSNRNDFKICLAGFVTITVMTIAIGIGGLGVFALVQMFGPMGQLGTWGWFWFSLLSFSGLLFALGFGWWAQRWLGRRITVRFRKEDPAG